MSRMSVIKLALSGCFFLSILIISYFVGFFRYEVPTTEGIPKTFKKFLYPVTENVEYYDTEIEQTLFKHSEVLPLRVKKIVKNSSKEWVVTFEKIE